MLDEKKNRCVWVVQLIVVDFVFRSFAKAFLVISFFSPIAKKTGEVEING